MPSARRQPVTRQVNFRLPVPVCVRLEAAGAALGITQARIVADAVSAYLDALPIAKRRVIEDVLALRQKA